MACHELFHQWEVKEFGRHSDLAACVKQHTAWIVRVEEQTVLVHPSQSKAAFVYMWQPYSKYQRSQARPCFRLQRSSGTHHSRPYDEGFLQNQNMGMPYLSHKALEPIRLSSVLIRIDCYFRDNVTSLVNLDFHWKRYSRLLWQLIFAIRLSCNQGMKVSWIFCNSKLLRLLLQLHLSYAILHQVNWLWLLLNLSICLPCPRLRTLSTNRDCYYRGLQDWKYFSWYHSLVGHYYAWCCL